MKSYLLDRAQKEAKQRHHFARINPVAFSSYNDFSKQIKKLADKTNVDYCVKVRKITRTWLKECPVIEDVKKPFVRPKAEYSNTSPYGIAAELHFNKDLLSPLLTLPYLN